MKEAAEIKKIPCAVCRDLMPLVQDGVASPESEALVKAHLAACPACRALQQGTDAPAVPELPAPDDGKILQKLRRRYSTHLLLLAFVGIAAGVALGYTGSANWVILFLPCVWAVLTCRDTGMGKPLLLFTLGLAVLDAAFDKVLLQKVPSRLCAQVLCDGKPTEADMQTVLHTLKQVLENNDMPITYYDITLVPTGDYADHSAFMADVLESGLTSADTIA